LEQDTGGIDSRGDMRRWGRQEKLAPRYETAEGGQLWRAKKDHFRFELDGLKKMKKPCKEGGT